MSTAEEVAALEAALKTARAKQAEVDQETPHTRVLGDLADHRINPVQLGETLARVFAGFEVLGVDLLAEGGPAKATDKKATPATETKKETK